jgi:hypothetical protein
MGERENGGWKNGGRKNGEKKKGLWRGRAFYEGSPPGRGQVWVFKKLK